LLLFGHYLRSKKNEKAYSSSDSEEYDDNIIEDPYQDDQIEKYHRNKDDVRRIRLLNS
jgi:hypothetical protein